MSESQSRYAGRYIALLKGLILVMLLLQVGLLFRTDRAFLSRPYFEDTFYAMTVSHWIAEGEGFTIDGVHPTNGVQPLICLLHAPSFMVSGGDLYLGLRLTMIVQIALYLLVGWAGARFLVSMVKGEEGKKLLFWLTFALIYVNYSLSVQFLNGLETSLVVGLTFLSLLLFNRIEEKGEGGLARYFGLGALLGLTVLARVDAVILIVALFLWKPYTSHRTYGHLMKKERLAGLRRVAAQLCMVGIGALLISSPWWLYNVTTFGNLVPVSGLSQQGLNTDNLLQVMETINVGLESIIPGGPTPSHWRVMGVAWAGLVVLLCIGVVLSLSEQARSVLRSTFAGIARHWNLRKLAPFAIAVLGFVLFYSFFFRAPHFQSRYLVLLTLIILFALVMIGKSAYSVAEMSRLVRKGGIGIVALVLSCSLLFFLRHYTGAYENMMLSTVDWIAQNTDQNDRLGIFQSGTVGFLYPKNVVNLDGKVNPAAFRAYKSEQFPRYVDSMDFDYIVDWKYYTDRVLYDSGLRSQYRLIDTLNNHMEVWKKVEAKEVEE